MIIIDGKQTSSEIRAKLKTEIEQAKREFKKDMGLAVVLVGDSAASKVYVKNKIKACEELGIKSYFYQKDASLTQADLENLIDELSKNNNIDGILVQLPLPCHLNEKAVINKIDPAKDVDGFSPYQMGKLALGEGELVACTPKAVLELIDKHNINLSGANAVIVGRSNIVGKPLFHLLLQRNATVTVCHTKTKNLSEITAGADVLIAAVGRPNLITASMVKHGACVIDVGINRLSCGALVGDVNFEDVAKKASYITPVPGGVGPMTITMLMANTLLAYKLQNSK
jgi:methylenetetrahydrofolate dehydrogenase (NADP+)/methenyltetrahydrofolate cyclohydrolase